MPKSQKILYNESTFLFYIKKLCSFIFFKLKIKTDSSIIQTKSKLKDKWDAIKWFHIVKCDKKRKILAKCKLQTFGHKLNCKKFLSFLIVIVTDYSFFKKQLNQKQNLKL